MLRIITHTYAHTYTCNYADCCARLWKGDELHEQRLITGERGKQSGELFAAWPLWNIQIILPPSTSLISAEVMSPVLAIASFFHRVYRLSRVWLRSRGGFCFATRSITCLGKSLKCLIKKFHYFFLSHLMISKVSSYKYGCDNHKPHKPRLPVFRT